MVDHSPPKPLLSSFLLNLALGVIAILPTIPAPFADWPSLDTALGKWLYVCSIALVVAALIYARNREQKRREWEQTQRDTEAESRHQATLANQREESDRIIAFMDQAASARAAIVQTGVVGTPLLTAIDNSGSLVTRLYADRQRRHIAAVTATEATALLREITQNPPLEPDAVRTAASGLNHYVMKAETGAFNVKGNDVRFTLRDEDGNVLDER
jgi:hypothetical protein